MITSTKTIGSKGEIVLPKKIREQLGLIPSSKVQIVNTESGILIIPLKKSFRELSTIFNDSKMNNFKEIEDLAMDIMLGI